MENNNTSGLIYFYKNRKLLIAAILIGAILGGVKAYLIPKKYLSTAIVYPYNSHTKDQIISNPQFGYEVETEQLLQLLESKSMRDRTVEKFNLAEYYEMDTTQPGWRSKLDLKYIKDVSFFRSKYLSVVINVTTKVPELSAEIANFQVEEVNRYREDVFRENRSKEFMQLEEKYFALTERKKNLEDSIYAIKEGDNQLIYNFVANLDNENYDASEFVNNPKLEALVTQYVYVNNLFNDMRSDYEKMKQTLETPLPSVYSIDKAVPSYKKASPSTLLNIAIGALVLFLLSLAFRLVLDKWIELKKIAE